MPVSQSDLRSRWQRFSACLSTGGERRGGQQGGDRAGGGLCTGRTVLKGDAKRGGIFVKKYFKVVLETPT